VKKKEAFCTTALAKLLYINKGDPFIHPLQWLYKNLQSLTPRKIINTECGIVCNKSLSYFHSSPAVLTIPHSPNTFKHCYLIPKAYPQRIQFVASIT
jgi:hypothetical protein